MCVHDSCGLNTNPGEYLYIQIQGILLLKSKKKEKVNNYYEEIFFLIYTSPYNKKAYYCKIIS